MVSAIHNCCNLLIICPWGMIFQRSSFLGFHLEIGPPTACANVVRTSAGISISLACKTTPEIYCSLLNAQQ